jgi:hypothetical protein
MAARPKALNPQQVKKVRTLRFKWGVRPSDLALRFGVSERVIKNACHGGQIKLLEQRAGL